MTGRRYALSTRQIGASRSARRLRHDRAAQYSTVILAIKYYGGQRLIAVLDYELDSQADSNLAREP